MKLQKLISAALMLAGLSLSFMAGAEQAGQASSSQVMVYIDPQDYRHDARINNIYHEYWVNRAEAVEPIVLNALKPLFTEAGMCRGGEAADVVLALKPSIFYNPHMTTLYGSIVAYAYSGSGKPIATYHAESQAHGLLDIQPAAKVQFVYQDAMQKIADQMHADTTLMALATNGLAASETKMPCEMISVLRAK